MPRAVFSLTKNNPFYYKQSILLSEQSILPKTINPTAKQSILLPTYCYWGRSTHLTLLIYISMSMIEKVFKYEATELPVIKYEDEIWFKAVAVATILKYTNQRKAIRDHVDPEDKRELSELMSKSKWNE